MKQGALFRSVVLPWLLCSACGGTQDVGPEPEREGERVELPPQEQLAPLFGEDAERGSVVVSLTFDDGFASQARFFELLEENDIDSIKGTFFINSSRLNLELNERESRDHLSFAALDLWYAAAMDGHEIGSHTVSHLDLSCTAERYDQDLCQSGHEALDSAEVRRQVCGDGRLLTSLGFDVTGFAYPFGRDLIDVGDHTLHDLVARCGFDYARDTNGLRRGIDAPGTEPVAETVPPANGFAIRGYDSLHSDVRFDDMRRWILDAIDEGGGWVPLVFHHISEDCKDPDDPEQELGVCVLENELGKLLRWLGRVDSDDAAPERVFVRTTGQVMAEVGPWTVLQVANGDLEDRHSGSIARPNCFDRFEGRHEDNFEWVDAGDLPGDERLAGSTGYFERLIPTTSHPTPLIQMTTRDDRCYLGVTEGASYQLRVRARSPQADKNDVRGRFVVRVLSVTLTDERADPVWREWDLDSEPQPVRQQWATQTLNLPPLDDGVVAIAFGYQYISPAPDEGNGAVEVWLDDFAIVEYVP